MSLTKRQREQLRELADIRDNGSTGEAYWRPTGSGEHRTATALERRGYLARDFSNLGGGSSLKLTEAGYRAARLDGNQP